MEKARGEDWRRVETVQPQRSVHGESSQVAFSPSGSMNSLKLKSSLYDSKSFMGEFPFEGISMMHQLGFGLWSLKVS